MKTLKQFLNGRSTAIIGIVTALDGEKFSTRLRHAPRIGCVTVEIAPVTGGKWEHISGRFSDETNMRHLVSCVREDNLKPDCPLVLNATAQAEYAAAETASAPSSTATCAARGHFASCT